MSTSRLQLALNVRDIDAATTFYERLFGVAPAKRRPGYANFAIDDPPLKLVLFESDAETPLNHLGVELLDAVDVTAVATRLDAAGLPHRVSEQEHCCHAVQDKVWVEAPDVPLGAWELYVVLADDLDRTDDGGACGDGAHPTAAATSPCCR